MDNYHPIPILPKFSTNIERVVCLQIMHYPLTHSKLSTAQYDSRKNASIELTCQDAFQYICSNFEMGNHFIEIFIDQA